MKKCCEIIYLYDGLTHFKCLLLSLKRLLILIIEGVGAVGGCKTGSLDLADFLPIGCIFHSFSISPAKTDL
jgi:hypothetical protein